MTLGAAPNRERRALQWTVAICSMVPIAAGSAGIVLGPALLAQATEADGDLDSHFRYLSGLLLGVGLAYLTAVPGIDRSRARFLMLGGIVVLGGLGRLAALLADGPPSPGMLFALAMELVVAPAITLWQIRISSGRQRR